MEFNKLKIKLWQVLYFRDSACHVKIKWLTNVPDWSSQVASTFILMQVFQSSIKECFHNLIIALMKIMEILPCMIVTLVYLLKSIFVILDLCREVIRCLVDLYCTVCMIFLVPKWFYWLVTFKTCYIYVPYHFLRLYVLLTWLI